MQTLEQRTAEARGDQDERERGEDRQHVHAAGRARGGQRGAREEHAEDDQREHGTETLESVHDDKVVRGMGPRRARNDERAPPVREEPVVERSDSCQRVTAADTFSRRTAVRLYAGVFTLLSRCGPSNRFTRAEGVWKVQNSSPGFTRVSRRAGRLASPQ